MVRARTRALNRLVLARTKQTSEQTIAIALEERTHTDHPDVSGRHWTSTVDAVDVHFTDIFIMPCFPASGKKKEAPLNTHDYTVPNFHIL